MVKPATNERPKFGEPFPTLAMDDFHAINAATIHHAPTTNDDLMHLIRLRPSWETFAPASVTPHLLRRILSDDTAIRVLTETVTELYAELANANRRVEQEHAAAKSELDDFEAVHLSLHGDRDYWQDTAVEATARAQKAEAIVTRVADRIAELDQRDTADGGRA